MRTTKRPAWTITPGTRVLIDGQAREVVRVFDQRTPVPTFVLSVAGMVDDGLTSSFRFDRLAPVVIVLDHQQEAA